MRIESTLHDTSHHIVFPGAGSFWWWESGTIQALQDRFNLKDGNFSMYGASAGSIASVMAACNVNMHDAMAASFRLPKKSWGVTHGHLIQLWLQQILPDDCHTTCSGKVHISVTTITLSFKPLHRKVVSLFTSKEDLINACLASSHIPFFLDGYFSRTFRGECCVDGSFLMFLHHEAWPKDELANGKKRALMMFYKDDKELMKRHFGILQVLDRESTLEMFNLGHQYGNRVLNRAHPLGLFDNIQITK
jgi:hypothetical protein